MKKIFQSLFNFSKRIIRMSSLEYVLYFVFPFYGSIKRKKILLEHAYENVSHHLDSIYIMK
jgi:hypothetical protein